MTSQCMHQRTPLHHIMHHIRTPHYDLIQLELQPVAAAPSITAIGPRRCGITQQHLKTPRYTMYTTSE